MSELKTKATDASVDAFLQSIPDEARRQGCYEKLKIIKKATGTEPTLFGSSIVGLGDHHYVYGSGREGDWFITGSSPSTRNLTFFMKGGFDAELLMKLEKYKTGNGCLYINRLEDVDKHVLAELIAKSMQNLADA